MNSPTPENHIVDDIPVYLTDGMSAADRESFESHVAACPACAAALAEARTMDESLRDLFASAKPGADFENRLIARFRQKTTRRTLHPMVRRVAIGVAATLLMGSAGAFYQRNAGRFDQIRCASNLKQIGLAMMMYSNGERNLGQNTFASTRHSYYTDIHNATTASAAPPALVEGTENKANLYYYEREESGRGVTANRGDSSGPVLLGRDVALKDATVSNGITGKLTILNGGSQAQFRNPIRGINTADAGISLNGENNYTGATTVNAGGLVMPLPSSGAGGGFGGGAGVANSDIVYGNVTGGRQSRGAVDTFAAGANAAPAVYSNYTAAVPPSAAALAVNGKAAGQSTLPQGVVNFNTASTADFARLPDGSNKTETASHAPAAQWNAIIAAPTDAADKPAATPAASSTPAPVELAQVVAQEKTPSLQVAAGDTDGDGKKPVDNQQHEGPPGVAGAIPPVQTAAVEAGIASRKIIREGELTFEVDSFDSTVMTISKIVGEETGFVSTTDSDKLANGKVKGTVVLRVPPEHLDTLVLKLRGIGDLKSQKITAQDITKQYTDLESELRAAKAMEERLLDVIKNGKGAVKDLLEAEKQLGVWREKIEQVEGEIRYDNSLVSLSTLTITLMERDIKAAASTSITEQVTMSLETENVEQAYTATRDAIDRAKGRIVQSELKQFDAGQFGATIKAQLPPDEADAVIARIRQIDGRIANFQRQRAQNNEGGSAAPLDATKVKHEDVTLALTIYNLANIAPRRTTSLTIVAANVDDVYAAVLDQAAKAGARVVSSNLNHPRPDQSSGTISLSQASDKTDALLATLRANGELLGQESTDNPDTQNVTAAKRGVVVQVISLATVQARQSETLGIASTNVPATFGGILDALRATDARIIASQLNQQDPTNQTATIVFDISRAARPSVDAAIDKLGEVFARNITRSQDTANTLDSKVHCELTLQSADVLPPRQTTTLGVEVRDVQKSVEQLLTAASDMGGREIDKDISQDQNGRTVAHVIVEVPLTKADALGDQIEGWGNRRSKQVNHNTQAPQGKLARGRLEVTLADAATGLGGEETTWDALRNGLNVSGQGLRWSVQMLTIGACIILPWVLVIWVGWKLLKRRKQRKAVVAVPA